MLSCLFSTPRALRDQFRATHAPLKGLHRIRIQHNFALCAAILAVRAERRITETMLNAAAFMLRQCRDFLKNLLLCDTLVKHSILQLDKWLCRRYKLMAKWVRDFRHVH